MEEKYPKRLSQDCDVSSGPSKQQKLNPINERLTTLGCLEQLEELIKFNISEIHTVSEEVNSVKSLPNVNNHVSLQEGKKEVEKKVVKKVPRKQEKANTPNKTKRVTNSSVQRNTVPGSEYQRILQILLRQRGFQFSDFKLGIEVSGVGKLDDMVYIKVNENKTRFFQVKYSMTKSPLVMSDFFKTSFSETEKSKPYLQLLLYFKSFCEIKENAQVQNTEIEEITFVTNRTLKVNSSEQQYQNFFVQTNLQNDHFLNLGVGKGVKYSLNVDLVKKQSWDILQNYSKEHLKTKLEMADQIIHEFLEKIRVVVDYPDMTTLKHHTFQEVFKEDIFCLKDLKVLESCVLHMEIELLANAESEYLTNKDWKCKIEGVKEFIKKLMLTGITDYKTCQLSREFGDIVFENENVIDMYEDVTTLLKHNENGVLFCKVQNVELNAIKILNILQQLKRDGGSFFKGDGFNYYSIEDLLAADFVAESFLSDSFESLVITCKNNYEDVENVATKLGNALKHTTKKIILIADSGNNFADSLEKFTNMYSEKQYNHGFADLNKISQEKILGKMITFQGEILSLGSLFNHDFDFANNVIDENCLWEIVNTKNPCILSNKDAFISSGYNEKYYVARSFTQRSLDYTALRNNLTEHLFLITGVCGVQDDTVKEVLIQNGINENCIHKWNINVLHDKGIIIAGSQSFSIFEILSRLMDSLKQDDNVKIVHWLFMTTDGKVIHINSEEKLCSEKSIVKTNSSKINEAHLLTQTSREKVVIVVGDSGVGKSTVLTSIANRIKSEHPHFWVIRVNLSGFFKTVFLKDIGDLSLYDNCIKILKKMTIANSSVKFVEEKLLREVLKQPHRHNLRIVLLLDGFNEVSKSFQKVTCCLIRTLKTDCNIEQIWVTTQIQGKFQLESELEVPAYFLNTFNHDEQVKLVAQYWATEYSKKTPYEEYSDNKLMNDADTIIKKLKHSIKDKEDNSFTEVSLNLLMLADVLLDSERQFDGTLGLNELYTKFVRKRFCIYSKETECTDVVLKNVFENSIERILQELAVKTIFSPNQCKSSTVIEDLPAMEELEEFKHSVGIGNGPVNILTKIGILTEREGELDFSHHSFAHFFLSQYVLKHLHRGTVQDFLIKHVLRKDCFHLTRQFLDIYFHKYFVGKDCEENMGDPIPNMKKTMEKVKTWYYLFISIKESRFYIIRMLLESRKEDEREYIKKIFENAITANTFSSEYVKQKTLSVVLSTPIEMLPQALKLMYFGLVVRGNKKY